MDKKQSLVAYFEKPGKVNTARTISYALLRAEALRIKHLVVASTTGATALKLVQKAKHKYHIVCVTHHAGFAQPGKREIPSATEKKLIASGVSLLCTTHLFAGIDRAVRLKFGGLAPAEIVANTYRTLGEGVKVAVEIAGMALDAGLIPYGEDVISIAGTGIGADTAIVIQPAHSNRFFETRIKEIICKTFNW